MVVKAHRNPAPRCQRRRIAIYALINPRIGSKWRSTGLLALNTAER